MAPLREVRPIEAMSVEVGGLKNFVHRVLLSHGKAHDCGRSFHSFARCSQPQTA